MYGTVNELAARLLRDYPADEKLTLIIWSLHNVHNYAEEPGLTDGEAGQILADIDTLCTHEGGVGGKLSGQWRKISARKPEQCGR